MYYCDKGIVLRHRDVNEYDRIVTIFTVEYGRVEVNFKSVNKSQAKLRSLSELFCYGDYRFYLRKYGAMPLCIGGSIISSFPEIRKNLNKILFLSFVCDVYISLTPVYQKSHDKFNLLLSMLEYLNSYNEISKWSLPVFILNFLEYYGVGFKNTNIGYDSEFWEKIHKGFKDISELDVYENLYDDVFDFAVTQLSRHTNKKYNFEEIISKGGKYVFSGFDK